MNIVFVVDHFSSQTDGTIITARRFCAELERLGHNVRVVAMGIEGENYFGVKERYIPLVSNISRLFNVRFAKYDEKILRKAFEGADLVHLFMPFQLERKAFKLAQKMGIPTTAAFHVHPENITKNAGLKNAPRFLINLIFNCWKRFYNRVGHIHCPSKFTSDELNKYGYASKLHVISNGVAPAFMPAEQSAPDDGFFNILMVGRLATEKRQDLLIKAVASSKYKDIIKITFAGSGPQEQKLRKMSDSLTNKPAFEFLKQEQLIEKIRSSNLYVHAADIEIEGISCLEAISCGLPALIGSAEKSATKQFALNEKFLFEGGNAESLRQKLEYWIENREELKDMGLKYAEYAKANFSLAACVDKAVEMFKSAIEDHNNKRMLESVQKPLPYYGTGFGESYGFGYGGDYDYEYDYTYEDAQGTEYQGAES